MYEQVKILQEVLVKARKYVQMAHDDAECKHDNYGDLYMDSDLYETVIETDVLLEKIDYLGRHKI